MTTLIASASPAFADVPIGESVVVALTVGNVSEVIDAYQVRVFGLDAHWVTIPSGRLSLFPGVTETIDVHIQLPPGFAAGVRQLSLQVQSENDPSAFEICPLTLNVARQPGIGLSTDPISVTGGKRAQFGLLVQNRGNSPLDVTPGGIDPEDTAAFEFAPSGIHLLPGERGAFEARVTGPRPWFGQPVVRVLTFSATAANTVESIATFVQRPRISRWVLSMLGLITAAAIFAAVLSHTFGSVVDKAKVSDAVVNEALADKNANAGAKVSVTPGSITGTVMSTSSGKGVAGVQAQLFAADNGTVALSSAATADDGSFAFGHLSAGSFKVKFAGAGFNSSWYKAGKVFADADPVDLAAGQALALDAVNLGGQPGTVKGKVIGTDITGTTASLVVPGLADANTPAVVAKADVSVDGTFLMEKVPTPATYQLVIDHPGSALQTRTVEMAPGETTSDIIFRLNGGNGVITGRVLNGGAALGGVEIDATDGKTKLSTVSLTEGVIGSYSLRDLATPGQYTLSVSRPGFAPQSRTISLPASGDPATWDILLTPSIGSIAGTVNASSGGPLGSVTVTISGGKSPVTTSTISQGAAAGSWAIDSLDVPGSYTVTFTKAGYVSQTRLVQLPSPTTGAAVTGVDAAMVSNSSTIVGSVLNATGDKVAQATISLSNGTAIRSMQSANEAIGAFGFSNVTPGSYTITATLTGTLSVVQVVTVRAGETKDLTIQLGAQASLTGFVFHADGVTPQVGMTVRLYLPANFPGGPAAAFAATTTRSDGSFSFTAITAPSNYIVAIYPSVNALDALDSQQIASVPGQAVPIPPFANG